VQGLRQSDFLRQIIEKAVSSDDEVILRKSALTSTVSKKFYYWLKTRPKSTLKDLVIEAINKGLGLTRWGL